MGAKIDFVEIEVDSNMLIMVRKTLKCSKLKLGGWGRWVTHSKRKRRKMTHDNLRVKGMYIGAFTSFSSPPIKKIPRKEVFSFSLKLRFSSLLKTLLDLYVSIEGTKKGINHFNPYLEHKVGGK